MPDDPLQHPPSSQPPARPPFFDRRKLRLLPPIPKRRGLLAGMRIRKKLIFLHTLFSIALAAVLLVAMRPAVTDVIARAELDEARLLLDAAATRLTQGADP